MASNTFGQRDRLKPIDMPAKKSPPQVAAVPVSKRPNNLRQDIGSSGPWGRTVRFGLAAAVGAVITLVAGHYFIPAVPAYPISFWFEHPIQYGHWKWTLGGAIAGIVTRYCVVDD
jgi:hypothetical protein